jgi:hypothetical protein
MEFVGEQDPTSPSTRATTTKAEYHTRKAKAVIILSHEELAEADSVDTNFEATVLDSFSVQLSNDVANAAWNGDRSLGSLTRLQRSLNGVDGIDVQTAAGGVVVNRGGAAFNRKLYGALYDRIPQKWRNDRKRLRWFVNDSTDNHYRETLTQLATPMGDSMHTTTSVLSPLGVRPVMVPQIADTQGPTAIAPTSAADNTTTIQFVLTTLVTAGDPVSAAAGVGRRFLVTCTATGQSEVCEGILDTTLRINTAGLLGQTTVSTTPGDYTVRPYDETTVLLGDPKGITIVWKDQWRMYRKYNEQLDQLEITIYLEFDILVPVPSMFLKATNIAIPPLPFS